MHLDKYRLILLGKPRVITYEHKLDKYASIYDKHLTSPDPMKYAWCQYWNVNLGQLTITATYLSHLEMHNYQKQPNTWLGIYTGRDIIYGQWSIVAVDNDDDGSW